MSLILAALLLLWQRVQGRIEVHPRTCDWGVVHHVHLAVGPDPSTSMTVSFASYLSQYHQRTPPVGGVLLGRSPNDMNEVYLEDAKSSPTHYNLTVPPEHVNVASGNRYYSPFYHHVTLQGLEPNTTYYYKPIAKPTMLQYEMSNYILHSTDNDQPLSRTRTDEEKMADALQALEQAHQLELEMADQEGKTVELDQNGRRHLLRQHGRRLVGWPPYDGSDLPCPSPDKIRSFTTAPRAGPDVPVTFALVGDLGQFPHSEETIASLMTKQMDTILLAGDIAYTQDDPRRWDTFFDFLDDYPLVDAIPMQICPGNHDIDKIPDGDDIFLAYENRFRMPRVHPPVLGRYLGPRGKMNMDTPPYPLPYEWGNAYYSFTYGSAHVLMLSAYSSMEPNSTQYDWVVKTLQSVDRSVTPWLLVVIHTPLYNTFSLHHRDLQIVAAKEHLEPLLVKYKVNLVFSGHIHAYSRTLAVRMDELDPVGPIHITIGAGGRKCEAPFTSADPEPWVAVRDATFYGYGMLELVNSTQAVWTWIHTGHTDGGRTYNQLWRSNATLPAGPGRDRIIIPNSYLLDPHN